jgi:hypothetical protein
MTRPAHFDRLQAPGRDLVVATRLSELQGTEEDQGIHRLEMEIESAVGRIVQEPCDFDTGEKGSGTT